MMTYFYISLIANAVLLIWVPFSLYLLYRAGKNLNEYENFYVTTRKQLEAHMAYVSSLVDGNVVLENDESVKNIFKAMEDFNRMLHAYVDAGKP